MSYEFTRLEDTFSPQPETMVKLASEAIEITRQLRSIASLQREPDGFTRLRFYSMDKFLSLMSLSRYFKRQSGPFKNY